MSSQNKTLSVLSRREAAILSCIIETLLELDKPLPSVGDTTAIPAFDQLIASSPISHRIALQTAIHLADLTPLLLLERSRLRRLPTARRAELLAKIKNGPRPLAQAIEGVRALAALSYYGDRKVSKQLGFNSKHLIKTSSELRSKENRP